MAQSTHTSYERAVRYFQEFIVAYHGQSTWPSTVQQVAAFIAHLSLSDRAPSTIANYVSGISYFHKINLWPDPTSNFLICKLLEGARRQAGQRVDSRRPVTFGLLVKFLHALPQICRNGYEAKLFQAAFSLAYFAFLRVGEFTAVSKNADVTQIIHLHDVCLMENRLLLTIRHAKNNQLNKPVTIEIVGFPKDGVASCPVRLLGEYLKVRPGVLSSKALFIHWDGSPLTRYQFQAILTQAAKFCNLNCSEYKTHSFRIGAASSCAIAGVSVERIKQWGRWNSSAYQTYIRPQPQVLAAAFM